MSKRCGQPKEDGSPCRRRIPDGAMACYQHGGAKQSKMPPPDDGAYPAKLRREKHAHLVFDYRAKRLSYREIMRRMEDNHGVSISKDTVSKWLNWALDQYRERNDKEAERYIVLLLEQNRRAQLKLDAMIDALEDDNDIETDAMAREIRQAIKEQRAHRKEIRDMLGLDAPDRQEVDHKSTDGSMSPQDGEEIREIVDALLDDDGST